MSVYILSTKGQHDHFGSNFMVHTTYRIAGNFSGRQFSRITAVFQDLATINRQRPTVNEDYACAM